MSMDSEVSDALVDLIRAVDTVRDIAEWLDTEARADLAGDLGRIRSGLSRTVRELKDSLPSGSRGFRWSVEAVPFTYRTWNFPALLALADERGVSFEDLWAGGGIAVSLADSRVRKRLLPLLGIAERHLVSDDEISGHEMATASRSYRILIGDPEGPVLNAEEMLRTRLKRSEVSDPSFDPILREFLSRRLEVADKEADSEDEPDTDGDWAEYDERDLELDVLWGELDKEAENYARSSEDGWFYDDKEEPDPGTAWDALGGLGINLEFRNGGET